MGVSALHKNNNVCDIPKRSTTSPGITLRLLFSESQVIVTLALSLAPAMEHSVATGLLHQLEYADADSLSCVLRTVQRRKRYPLRQRV